MLPHQRLEPKSVFSMKTLLRHDTKWVNQFLVAHQSSDVILRMHETCTKQRVRPQICTREEAATTKHIMMTQMLKNT